MASVNASDGADEAWFGRSVSISGDTVVVGAYGADGAGSDQGAAYIYNVLQPYRIYLPLIRND
jgi:hypothetical protein